MKQGEEIVASEEYQIENFEDGTSILVINDVYPDDAGVFTFEATNPLGVAVATTELVIDEGRNICLVLNCFFLNNMIFFTEGYISFFVFVLFFLFLLYYTHFTRFFNEIFQSFTDFTSITTKKIKISNSFVFLFI